MNKINGFIGLACAATFSQLHAAALDRSGQSIQAFLQSGHYFEAGLMVLDPTVSGKMKPDFDQGGLTAAAGMPTGDIANSYMSPFAALKLQLNPKFSFGLLYDHPFGADAENPIQQYPVYTEGNQQSSSEVVSQNITALFGYQPMPNWNLYAGPVYQTVKGESNLYGAGYLWVQYQMTAKETSGTGWIAGLSYSIPDIALQAAITYRSEIDHDLAMTETINVFDPNLGRIDMGTVTGKSTVTTPSSVNIDLQTGIMANTIAFANLRWVDWTAIKISPQGLKSIANIDLALYSDDQFSAEIGLGRKFNAQWSGSISAGWDSGAGNPVTILGPTEGYWSAGLGLKFNPASNYDISFGAKYFWLGDAKGHSSFDYGTDRYDAIFSDNYAWGYGMKIGYHF